MFSKQKFCVGISSNKNPTAHKLDYRAPVKAFGIMVLLGLGACSSDTSFYQRSTEIINQYYLEALTQDDIAIKKSKIDLYALVEDYKSDCDFDASAININEQKIREYFECARVQIDAIDIGQNNLKLFLDDQTIKHHLEDPGLRKVLDEVKADNKVTLNETVEVYRVIDQIDAKENKDRLSKL